MRCHRRHLLVRDEGRRVTLLPANWMSLERGQGMPVVRRSRGGRRRQPHLGRAILNDINASML